MGHTVALKFEDGVTQFVECRGYETIADASYRVGINIPPWTAGTAPAIPARRSAGPARTMAITSRTR